jgi:hypothetical protein
VGGGLIDARAAAPPPRVSVSGPPALTNDRTPSFAFAANRSATFRCSLDGGAAQACSPPFTSLPLGDGAHSLVVSATDVLGHVGAGAPFAFTVDATAPHPTIHSGPRRATRNPRPRFRFDSNDPGASLRCRFDARALAPCSRSARPGARLGDGVHRFRVVAVDAAGNVGPTAKRMFTVDTKRPRVRLRGHPRRRTTSHRARFRFSASERARFQCRLDGRAFRRCRSPRKVPVGRGGHTFRVRAVDRAGNVGKAKRFRWRVG